VHECASQISNLLSTFLGSGKFCLNGGGVLFFLHFYFPWKQHLHPVEDVLEALFSYIRTVPVVLCCTRIFENVKNEDDCPVGCCTM
jgi:hypothetical protein